jgi:probable HAF family extracellular repeat protein
MIRTRCAAWAVCALTLLATAPARAQPYTLTDLEPAFGEGWWSGIQLNNRGQVLTNRALWTPGEGVTPLPFDASSLNDVGQVVGSSAQYPVQGRAIRWSAATGPQDVGPGTVSDINNRGDMVGWIITDYYQSWRQPAGAPREALRLSDTDFGLVVAINENGAATGYQPGGPRLEYWPPGETTAQRLDTGRIQTYANDINASGQIAGQAEDYKAYLYTPGQGIQSLGELKDRDTWARGLNDRGHVVGSATDDIDSDRGLAFLWTPGLGMSDLNDLVDASAAGWTLTEAWAINNAGQIVGFGQHGGVNTRVPFLLTPVPEPGGAVAASLAAAVLLSRRRLAAGNRYHAPAVNPDR